MHFTCISVTIRYILLIYYRLRVTDGDGMSVTHLSPQKTTIIMLVHITQMPNILWVKDNLPPMAGLRRRQSPEKSGGGRAHDRKVHIVV